MSVFCDPTSLKMTLSGGQRIKAIHTVSPTVLAFAVQEKGQKRPQIKVMSLQEGSNNSKLESHSLKEKVVVRKESGSSVAIKLLPTGDGYVCQRAEDENALTLVKLKGFEM